jgi:cystathionine beta-synthase
VQRYCATRAAANAAHQLQSAQDMMTREVALAHADELAPLLEPLDDGEPDDDITLAEPVRWALDHRSRHPLERAPRPRPATRARTRHGPGSARVASSARGARAATIGTLDGAMAWTPMVRLSRLIDGHPCTPLAKCAYLGLPGSLDYRAATAMLRRAEARGRTRRGDTLVAPSRGDSAIGLAMAAAAAGYRLVITAPLGAALLEQVAIEALGARVIRTPADVAPDAHTGYLGVARRLSRSLPDAHLVRSWARPSQAHAPETLLAAEIVHQCGNELDVVVVPSQRPGDTDALGRAIAARAPRARLVEVVVDGAVTASAERGRLACSSGDAAAMARHLARREGLLVGPRSGAAARAALDICRELSSSHNVVAILPDGFDARAGVDARTELSTALELVTAIHDEPAICVGADDGIATAMHLFRRHAVSHLAVIAGDRLVGIVSRLDVVRRLEGGSASHASWVRDVMSTRLPTVQHHARASEVFAAIERDDVAVVVDGDLRVFGVVGRADLAAFFTRQEIRHE